MKEEGKWYKNLFDDKKKLPNRFYIYVLITMFPSIILITFIHEFGHYIIAILLGWNVSCMDINLLPFTLDFESAYICLSSPLNTPPYEWVLVAIGGSLHTLIWGYIFFILYYKFKLPPILEVFCFLYSIMFISEISTYILFDIFFLQMGDWQIVYQNAPLVIPIFLILSFLNIHFYLKNFDEIRERLEIS
jgi:hypothetical protein